MKFHRQSGQELSINLTPLIDVVFILLIFFMVSTTFKKESHIRLTLPEADGEQAKASARQIDVIVSVDGSYSVNGKGLVNSKIDTLRTAIKRLSGDKNDLPFVISADAKAPHQSVVTAMDAAGQLGFKNLSIATLRRGEN